VIRALGLTKRYKGLLAVDGLYLGVLPGEVFGFLGPDGAGKTTTIALQYLNFRGGTGECKRRDVLSTDEGNELFATARLSVRASSRRGLAPKPGATWLRILPGH
jgi:ABC-type branched-subunit amino acid transport system ATPase component